MDGRGMGGAPMPEKTQGWCWGFLFGTIFGAVVTVLLFIRYA